MFGLAKDFKKKKELVQKFLEYFPNPLMAYKKLK